MKNTLIASILLLLGACAPQPEQTTLTSRAFDNSLTLTVSGLPLETAKKTAQSALDDLLFVAEVSHPWKPGPLGRTNQLLGYTAEFSANPSILPQIREATRLETTTRGYYAPALGKLQQQWGFHSDFPEGPVPDQTAIDAILDAEPSMQDVRLEGIRMKSVNEAVRIDFGALAQGHALDTARQRLKESGTARARIDNGNAVAVLGEEWPLQLPFGGKLTLQADEAAVTLTSDDYAFSENGRQYHRYINPHTGRPGSGLRSVTVLHPSTTSAAAIAQALMAGGEAKLAELLAVIPVEYALAITDDGRTIATAAMQQRLDNVGQQ